MIIALDGPAASGKGTLAKRLARHYDLPHLDTGLLYRAVGAAALEKGVDFEDSQALAALAAALDPVFEEEALKAGPVGEAASRVAAVPEVRTKLLKFQQDFARQPGGAVLDGRDIATVIAPEAQVKIFVTATPQARAERRFRELLARGENTSFDKVLDDIRRRDARDSDRSAAPLRKAEDALVLDNSTLSVEESWQAALALAESRIGRK